MTFVSDLRPQELWQHFDQILTIPRGSKKEEVARKYVISIADKNGLSCHQDAAGNVVVFKPGAPGRESAPIVILQAHLDMVNEKNANVRHDFNRDPIRPQLDRDYLTARGTTLGADNGIGVAAQLAILETSDVGHGPLELLFTVDEETGLTGAAQLEPGFLKGRRLINLDTEEEGAICVGCAGGAGVDLTLDLEFEPLSSSLKAFEVTVDGLRGGHSGIDIHLRRGNSIKILARALAAVQPLLRLADIRGGNMRNAIPREATALVTVKSPESGRLVDELNRALNEATREIRVADPMAAGAVSEADLPEAVCSGQSSMAAIDLLNSLPHGVSLMSYDIPDLVETSANLATVGVEGRQLKIHVSNRSSVHSALVALCGRVESMARLVGASSQIGEAYPGWQPNLESELLALARDIFQHKRGRAAHIKAVHAGLECGLIGEKFPGMDMISIGPQIEFPHSIDERVKIASVAEFWEILSAILEKLAAD